MTTKNDLTRSAELGADPRPQHAPTVLAHTPGPWEVFGPADHDYPGVEAVNADGTSRLSVVVFGDEGDSDDSGVHGATKAESDANARLIAAAPELLEALKEAVTDDGSGWLTRARAAIAKAEG